MTKTPQRKKHSCNYQCKRVCSLQFAEIKLDLFFLLKGVQYWFKKQKCEGYDCIPVCMLIDAREKLLIPVASIFDMV